MKRVFIDGKAGTTGLEIADRLAGRRDLELIEIDEELRKDTVRRRECMNAADVVVLCLPDDASREALTLIENPRTKVLDASTAHRVAVGWEYGLPELTPCQRERLRAARRVSNPGCYATGFILSIRPLIDAGVLAPDVPLTMHATSGYSGGGRALIDAYRQRERDGTHVPPRDYALGLAHKHIPEMHQYSGTEPLPIFVPTVGHYYKGMVTHVPLFHSELTGIAHARDVHALLAARYAKEPCIEVAPFGAEAVTDNGYLSPTDANDTDRLQVIVSGDATRSLVSARYDNLGKGAAGAAVQNLNLMLDLPEHEGLRLP